MGRLVLLTWVAALTASAGGCGPDSRVPSPRAGLGETAVSMGVPLRPDPEDPHAELACATCHAGPTADRGVGSVPSGTCTDSGCHSDGGPPEVALASVTFTHRDHGSGEPVEMECAGCHAHVDGSKAIDGGTESCGLCHSDQLDGDVADDCRLCHAMPTHVGFTSQDVAVPHGGMPWIEGECVRCHYDVEKPETHVEATSCSTCHVGPDDLVRRSFGEDLHPTHVDVGCVACHGQGSHGIVAMSSAVDLECAQCHARSHGVTVRPDFPEVETCNLCHASVHGEEQQLLLGVVPGRADTDPSDKFLAGLTCRSCHVAPVFVSGDPTARGVPGSEVSCDACHRPEYRTVLSWWNEGVAQRLALADAYLSRASRTLPSADGEARRALEDASDRIDRVRRGGGQHNLPLAHRLLSESLTRVGDAYRAIDLAVPPAPDLGRQPRMGLCSYCHYRVDDELRFGEMDERFHREALGLTGRGGGG